MVQIISNFAPFEANYYYMICRSCTACLNNGRLTARVSTVAKESSNSLQRISYAKSLWFQVINPKPIPRAKFRKPRLQFSTQNPRWQSSEHLKDALRPPLRGFLLHPSLKLVDYPRHNYRRLNHGLAPTQRKFSMKQKPPTVPQIASEIPLDLTHCQNTKKWGNHFNFELKSRGQDFQATHPRSAALQSLRAPRTRRMGSEQSANCSSRSRHGCHRLNAAVAMRL